MYKLIKKLKELFCKISYRNDTEKSDKIYKQIKWKEVEKEIERNY